MNEVFGVEGVGVLWGVWVGGNKCVSMVYYCFYLR